MDKDENLLSAVITRNNTPTDIDIYTGRLDIILPWRKSKLGFGAKFSYVKTNNNLDFFNDSSGISAKVPDRSYNFLYKENVNAAYITWQRQFNLKWALQAGVRMDR